MELFGAELLIAEAISLEPKSGTRLHPARLLEAGSPKRAFILGLLRREPVALFIRLHGLLCRYLHSGDPLVIVTDWSDPCEVTGLRLYTPDGTADYPALCFLALHTDWAQPEASGIGEIFAHELSHLWLHRMGYSEANVRANRFHTCTAITDPFLAFAEGFAEHLELVTALLEGRPMDALYDNGYDLGAWLCSRDAALRLHAAANNRFLYLTADPEPEDFDCYQHLHMAHITSSAFMPERLKNGAQAIASEGVVASFFYRLYLAQRNLPAPRHVCRAFGAEDGDLPPVISFYLRVLCALSRVDLTRSSLFTDFVSAYMDCFPEERQQTAEIFGQVTNYVTVSRDAAGVFGALYRIGRRGCPDDLKRAHAKAASLKASLSEAVLSGRLRLNAAVAPAVWVEGDKSVCPVPWQPQNTARLRFDANAATAVDFFSLEGLSFDQCRRLAAQREAIGGFADRQSFDACLARLRGGA